jgi:hypothetical protein
MHLFSQTERRKQNHVESLERLWAYLTIRQLLDQYLASTDKDSDLLGPIDLLQDKQAHYEDSSPKARALNLALKVCFVPRLSHTYLSPSLSSDGYKRHASKELFCLLLCHVNRRLEKCTPKCLLASLALMTVHVSLERKLHCISARNYFACLL